MKKIVALLVALASLAPAASLAHHSLANFDTATPVRVKGTIVQILYINPHSFIYLEEKTPDGPIRRWAAEGPAIRQLERAGFKRDALKAGDVIEVCGYALKEHIMWQFAGADPKAVSLAGRVLNAELLVMPDGQERNWGDYGVHRCFAPGFSDQHSK